jgi:hypothetical protein
LILDPEVLQIDKEGLLLNKGDGSTPDNSETSQQNRTPKSQVSCAN